MSEAPANIVGSRIWLDYSDQNTKFEEVFTPQSCSVLKQVTDDFGQNDWFLVKLDTAFEYDGRRFDHLLIRSRWVGCKIGDEEPASVSIVLVPHPDRLSEPLHVKYSLYVAWGMASMDTDVAHQETGRRQRFFEIMASIRSILFNDWDPIGVNDMAPDDEYDSYIGSIYRLLSDGASEAEIAGELRQLEITKMHSVTSPEHRIAVAEKLKKINVSINV